MKDVIIKPLKSIDLTHRVYFFSSRRDDVYASCSRNGKVTILNKNFDIVNTFDCSETIKGEGNSITVFGLHSQIDLFYIGSEDEYRVYNLEGKLLCSVLGHIQAVHFNKNKNLAWVAKYIDSGKKEICLIIDDAQQDSIIIEDELYDSAVNFQFLPEQNKICMLLLAGQDGMATYFLTNNNGKIEYEILDIFEEESIMDFSPDNSSFLALDVYGLDKITRCSYPYIRLEKEFILPEEYEEKECQLGYNLFYLDDKYAIVEIGENLYYILDADKMEIVGRFIVEGHEPKPISYYWPRLKGDEGETTNLFQLFKTSDYIISSYKKTPDDKEACSLLRIKIEDILSALN